MVWRVDKGIARRFKAFLMHGAKHADGTLECQAGAEALKSKAPVHGQPDHRVHITFPKITASKKIIGVTIAQIGSSAEHRKRFLAPAGISVKP